MTSAPHHHRHPFPMPDPGSVALRRLALVLALTAGYALAEVAGGLLSGSLALLADAGHMLTDLLALSLALVAAWSARRPPDPRRTYGYRRAEILAALFNGVALIVMASFIFAEAWQRAQAPGEVRFGIMGGVAAGGLIVNLIAARLLHGHHGGMNMRGAYLHVLGDLLGSLGALLAAVLIGWRGWYWADPAVSAVIGVIIITSAVRLVLASVQVLMEASPSHLDSEEVRASLSALPGVGDVHDLHLWSLGGDHPLLSAHLVLDHSRPQADVLRDAVAVLERRFSIRHTTLQIEPPDFNIVDRLSSGASSGGRARRDD